MGFFSVKVTLVDLGIIENYVLSNSFLYYLKKKKENIFYNSLHILWMLHIFKNGPNQNQ